MTALRAAGVLHLPGISDEAGLRGRYWQGCGRESTNIVFVDDPFHKHARTQLSSVYTPPPYTPPRYVGPIMCRLLGEPEVRGYDEGHC